MTYTEYRCELTRLDNEIDALQNEKKQEEESYQQERTTLTSSQLEIQNKLNKMNELKDKKKDYIESMLLMFSVAVVSVIATLLFSFVVPSIGVWTGLAALVFGIGGVHDSLGLYMFNLKKDLLNDEPTLQKQNKELSSKVEELSRNHQAKAKENSEQVTSLVKRRNLLVKTFTEASFAVLEELHPHLDIPVEDTKEEGFTYQKQGQN